MQSNSQTWIKYLARAGYFSRGVVYLIVGGFAIFAAWGAAQSKGTKGAVLKILKQPFGETLVVILIVGLTGYIMWRLVQSLLDTDNHGWSVKGVAIRLGLLSSAITYAGLALYSASLIGAFASDNGDKTGGLALQMGQIIGQNYVALVLACIFTGIAIAHWWKAISQKYADHFMADAHVMTIIHPISMVGLTARGIVFAIIATILIFRFLGVESGDRAPPDVKDALVYVQYLPFGVWLLSALGIGVILFAGYSFAEAIWRKINLEDASISDQM
ncbi:DUF1206 domain-containing protein [uncultured Cohaesibacter sp.]|uniref:DUF1206 domain-containing protein n=1 Tax=uncultured Cohaesibacter sp. TaxID=1002546 RepID=UPI002AA8026B|nr:DUF1206 domain-containing protein [uncultured Cohaesibacter sp.]